MRLLDTDIATLVLYARNERVMARYHTFASTGSVALPFVTWIEILRRRLDAFFKVSTPEAVRIAQQRIIETEEWLTGFERLDVSVGAAERFRQLRSSKHAKKIGIPDTLLAAIALDRYAILVTRNVKDFSLIPGLRIENLAA